MGKDPESSRPQNPLEPASFQKLQVESGGSELSIQAIEKKTGGAFVIRVEVPLDADKAKIEESFWQKYKPQLDTKDEKIAFYCQEIVTKRQENTKLIGIIETMAEKENPKTEMTFNGPVASAAGNVARDQTSIQHNYAPEQKQNLADAAAEIQQLLKQLEENNSTATKADKQAIAINAIHQEIKRNPKFKARLVNALKLEF